LRNVYLYLTAIISIFVVVNSLMCYPDSPIHDTNIYSNTTIYNGIHSPDPTSYPGKFLFHFSGINWEQNSKYWICQPCSKKTTKPGKILFHFLESIGNKTANIEYINHAEQPADS